MSVEKVQCTIKGIAPLLMNAFPMVSPPRGWEKWSAEKQAETCEYRDPDTEELYVPSVAFQRCLINGGLYSKGKGRSSLQKPVAACVIVSPERMGLGVKSYEVDSRAVVVPATKGRIVRHRPRFAEWSFTCEIEYDPELLSEEQLRQIVDDAGKRVGLLDFRPEKKGPFGRFIVTEWQA